MPYLLTKVQRMLEEVSYHPSMDTIAKLGTISWLGEEGGYMIGEIEGNCAYPTKFLESRNLERRMFNVVIINGRKSGGQSGSATDMYNPAIKWRDVNKGIGGVHTHPAWPAFCYRNPSKAAPISDGDIRHLWYNKVPFEVIATIYPWGFAYLQAWGLKTVPSPHRRSDIVARELGIVFDEKRFAGILYNDGEKTFVENDMEADRLIADVIHLKDRTFPVSI